MMKKILSAMLAALLLLGCLVGCSGGSGETVSTDGSTSMSRVIGALGEAFEQESGIKVSYNPTGSGSGIQAVLEGRCDIGLSSRNLKEAELASGLRETVLAYDGIAMIVHPENPVSNLTLAQLAEIYTGKITNWSALGGNNAEIVLIGREANSGTRDGFESITGTTDVCLYRQELSSNGDVITTVANNPNAIGYASLAAIKDSVRSVPVEGVLPSEASIRDGSYCVQRPFLLVTRTEGVLPEAAQRFYDYATSAEAAQFISAAGVVPAN